MSGVGSRRWYVLPLAVAALAGACPSVAAARGAAAAVRIEHVAREGQGGAVLVGLRARCLPGYVLQELVIGVRQGEVEATGATRAALACDGRWHRLRASSLERFEPGPAHVVARLAVVDIAHGDPAPQAVAERDVVVRAAALVRIARRAHVAADGRLMVRLRARCDRPWVESDLSVSGVQGASGATTSVPPGALTCDGRWHRLRLVLAAEAGFHAGDVAVDAFLTVLDPESFDPVAQARASRVVTAR